MLIDCACGQTNRIPGASKQRHRCGKCRHTFTPQELVKARIEPPPARPTGFMDSMMSESNEEPTHACKDVDDCCWEGMTEDLEKGRCPECGKKVTKLEDD